MHLTRAQARRKIIANQQESEVGRKGGCGGFYINMKWWRWKMLRGPWRILEIGKEDPECGLEQQPKEITQEPSSENRASKEI